MAADMGWGKCGAVGASGSILCVSKSAVARSGSSPVKLTSVPALLRLGKQVAVGSFCAIITLGWRLAALEPCGRITVAATQLCAS